MEINLDEILGGAPEPSETSFKSINSRTKANHNRVLTIQESYYSDDGQDKHSILKLDDSIFNVRDVNNQEESEASSTMERNSHTYKSGKAPGERLFYQSQALQMRRQKQIEIKKMEQQQKEEGLFKPEINQKSKQLKSKYTSDYNPKEQKKVIELRKKQHDEIQIKKKQDAIKQCTFKPTINTKTQILTKHRSTPAFQHLYHASKTQQIKKQLRAMQNNGIKGQGKPKAQVEKAFESFLQRNQSFVQKQKTKLDILDSKLGSYDSEGQKLFTPKISKKPLNMKKTSTYQKDSHCLKDLNEMLLNRIRKSQTIQQSLFQQKQQNQESN